MDVIATPKANEDLEKIDSALHQFFLKHFKKLETMPPRRHLRMGLPFCVENVTDQARFVYKIEGNTILITRCFATHKEYEKWYRSFQQ